MIGTYILGCAIALGMAVGDKAIKPQWRLFPIYLLLTLGSWITVGAVITDYGSQIEKYIQEHRKSK